MTIAEAYKLAGEIEQKMMQRIEGCDKDITVNVSLETYRDVQWQTKIKGWLSMGYCLGGKPLQGACNRLEEFESINVDDLVEELAEELLARVEADAMWERSMKRKYKH